MAEAGVEGSSCEYLFKLKSLPWTHLRCTRQRLHQLTTNRWKKLLLWRRGQLFPCLFASLCCPVGAALCSLTVIHHFLVFQFQFHELRDSLVCCSNCLSIINDLSFWSWLVVVEYSVFCCPFLAPFFWNLAGRKRELDELVALASLVWICRLGEKIVRFWRLVTMSWGLFYIIFFAYHCVVLVVMVRHL